MRKKLLPERLRVTPLMLVGLLSASGAYADFVTGTVGTNGQAIVNSTSISFFSPTDVANTFLTVTGPSTNMKAEGLTPSGNGTIENLNNSAEMVGTPFDLADWMVLSGAPISFTLMFINPGAGDFTAADCGTIVTGHACTIPGSSLNLLNTGTVGQTATAVDVSFSVRGTAIDTTDNLTDNFTGSFANSGPVVDTNAGGAALSNVAAIITAANAGHNLSAPYAGSFTASTVPEPSTFVLLGLGGLLLLGGRLRSKKRA